MTKTSRMLKPADQARRRALAVRAALGAWPLALLASSLCLVPSLSAAQAGVRVNARLASTVQISDDLGGGNATAADGGVVLTLSPGVVAVANTAALRGSLDYSLNAVRAWRYVLPQERIQHALRSSFQWVPAHTGFTLDGQAGISNQSLSTLDAQRAPGSPAFAGSTQGNQREVYSLSLGPSWSTRLGPNLQLRASHQALVTNTRNSLVGDANSSSTQLSLGTVGASRLSASMLLSSGVSRSKGQAKSKTDSANLRLNWVPDVDWALGLRVGRERSDLRQASSPESGATYGADLSWQPSQRTRVALDATHRVFGDTYSATLEHRLRRSTFRYNESRSVVLAGGLNGVNGLSNYDYWFQQFSGREPDILKRDALVRSFLRDQGLSPEASIGAGFINGSTSLSRQRSFSASWQGVRTSLSFVASTNDGTALGGTGSDQRNRTLGLNAAYRLTPLSSLALALTDSSGNSAVSGSFGAASNVKSISLNWSGRLGPQRQLSFQLRHSDAESVLRSYTENALFATLVQQF